MFMAHRKDPAALALALGQKVSQRAHTSDSLQVHVVLDKRENCSVKMQQKEKRRVSADCPGKDSLT